MNNTNIADAPNIIYMSRRDIEDECYSTFHPSELPEGYDRDGVRYIRADAPELVALGDALRNMKSDLMDRATIRTNAINGEKYSAVKCSMGAWVMLCAALAKWENMK